MMKTPTIIAAALTLILTLVLTFSLSSKDQSCTHIREKIASYMGNQAFKDKQWRRAIGFYTEAIKLNGSNATYYSNRCAAYLEIGSFIQAEADCSQAIDLDKKNVKAYLMRGTAREMLSYYKEAMEDFGYALVLEPNNKRASKSLDRLKKLFQYCSVNLLNKEIKIIEEHQMS